MRLLFALVLTIFATSATAEELSPRLLVKSATDSVIAALTAPAIDDQSRWRLISATVSEAFDFHSMSQSILATKWKTATPEEQITLTDSFSGYLLRSFRPRMAEYSGHKVEIGEETIMGDRAIVDTVIVSSGGTRTPIHYALRRSEHGWRAYDVVIEGISLVSHFRNRFAQVGARGGIQSLLTYMDTDVHPF